MSYIFAGEQDLDLGLALAILHRELGIQRVLLEGGGVTNGAFLRAGLIDELSLAIFPAVDGAKGAPCVFDSGDDEAGTSPLRSMALESSQVLEGGVVWLRYRPERLTRAGGRRAWQRRGSGRGGQRTVAVIDAIDTGRRGGFDPDAVDATTFFITIADEASTGESTMSAWSTDAAHDC